MNDFARSIHSVSWHEAHRDSNDLGVRLKSLGPWTGMVAISRGGLVPAALISRVLNIRLVETICLSSYQNETRGSLTVLKAAPPELGQGEGWLLVDDVADSGQTAQAVREMLPAAHHAVLYVKPAGRPFVDSFVRAVDQEVWIDFPWEREPTPL